MNAIFEKILDLPHATLLSYIGIVVAVVGYLNGTLTLEAAFALASGGTAAAGLLGHARNGAGRGVKKGSSR